MHFMKIGLLAAGTFFLAACATVVRPVPVQGAVVHSGAYVDIAYTDVMPVVISQARPIFPPRFREAGFSGDALIDFIVETDGRTSEVQCVRATDAAFRDAAITSISQWQFRPGKKDGAPVRVHMQVPMVFSITN